MMWVKRDSVLAGQPVSQNSPFKAEQLTLPTMSTQRRGIVVSTHGLIGVPTVKLDKYKIQVVTFGGGNKNGQGKEVPSTRDTGDSPIERL